MLPHVRRALGVKVMVSRLLLRARGITVRSGLFQRCGYLGEGERWTVAELVAKDLLGLRRKKGGCIASHTPSMV